MDKTTRRTVVGCTLLILSGMVSIAGEVGLGGWLAFAGMLILLGAEISAQ